jgi:hypothetical protein
MADTGRLTGRDNSGRFAETRETITGEQQFDLRRSAGQFEGMCELIQGDMPLHSTGGLVTLPVNENCFGQKCSPR